MSGKLRGPVVVGIDGTDEAMCAADYGAWEARRRRVDLMLVYVRHAAAPWGPAAAILADQPWEHDEMASLLTKTQAEMRAAHPDIAIEAVVANGGAAGVLVEQSATASLVVVGTRAAGGLRGHLSGSVAAQVAAHASSPVVALRGVSGRRYDRSAFEGRPVVVGVDGSAAAGRALEFAVEEAVARDSEVRAVLVWSLFDVHDIGPIVPATYDRRQEQDKADRLLDEALSGWSDRYPDLRITRHAVHDLDPVAVLVEQSRDAGLVVAGTRGHGGFLGLLLGSTVDGLIRHAHAPVAVVPGEVAGQAPDPTPGA